MKTARILALLLFLLVLSQDIPAWSKEPHKPATVAFVNVNVVPMDRERILPRQTVIVRADRISEVGPADTTDIPEGALRIDGRDKYLMPGLVDMHVHQPHDCNHQLILFIANGVTTIRNMWGAEYHPRLREQIEKGTLIGPTIYTTGPIIDGIPQSSPSGELNAVVEAPKQAAQAVGEHEKAGYNFIKVYGDLSLECYDAVIEAAAKHGMPVVGHVPEAVGLEHALAAGQHSVEHLDGYGAFLHVGGTLSSGPLDWFESWDQIDETKIPHIVRATRETGTWNCATLIVFQKKFGMSSEALDQERKLAYMKYVSPLVKQRWFEIEGFEEPNHSLRMSNRKRVTKALHDAGARILLGTDTPNPYVVPGFSLHQELQNFVDAGLTPHEAIKAGTYDAAECLGERDEFGTIRAGLRADLILIEDNPLEDVGNVSKRIGVMARGRWFPQSELQVMLDALAVKHATEENPDGIMLRGSWYARSELEAMVDWCKERVDAQNESQRKEFVKAILSSDRIFLAGDNGSAARFVAMNLTQLGLQAYVVGNATPLAIEKRDLLIVISRMGQSMTIFNKTSAAKNSGARVVLLTAQPPFLEARIRDISDQVFILGPDFEEATWRFIWKLVTATTVSLRRGVSASKMSYDDASDTYTIHGAGNEIWFASDQFYFTHKKLNGDGSITARIDSVESLRNWTKAGLMIRDTKTSVTKPGASRKKRTSSPKSCPIAQRISVK